MNQDTGVLRKSLLSLRREPTVSFDPRWTVAYKHFLIFFCQSKTSDGSDCIVFDTEKGTTFSLQTGLQFEERSDFTVCYWKDNIFVFYGGFRHKPDEPRGGLYNPEKLVHFLNVIENEAKISFTIESFPLADNQFWNSRHSAHIYRDNMYVLRGSNEAAHHEAFFKLDLNEKTWNRCKTGGDTPKSSLHTTVLSNGKIYFFVTDPNAGSPFRGGGGGLFGNMGKTTAGGGLFGGFGGQATRIEEVPLNFCVLDLETMKWQQVHKDKILSPSLKSGFFAETVGDRIYIWHRDLDEFLVYDPANNTILRSEGLPPNENWIIKSFQGSSIIFKIYHSPNESWIEYQSLGTPDQPEKQEEKIILADPLVDSYQQLRHMEYIWKEKPFADITFVVGTEEIQAHRAILLKCRYFQNMFKSGMIESNSNKINVPDISSVNFKAILEYIYLDKIALTEVLAMELIILADLYFLPSLKADCEKYLSEKLTISNFAEIMRVAQTADSEKLEKRVVGFLTSNIEKIKQEIDIHVIPPELFIRAIVDLKSPKK